MYAGIFIGDYAKTTALKEHHSGPNMIQDELTEYEKYKDSVGFKIKNPV